MIIKDYFINHFSLLVSARQLILVDILKSSRRDYCSYVNVLFFPYMGFSYDLRVVPLILSFIYFGRIAGWITLISIIVMRIFYTGGYWEPPVIAYLGMGILFLPLKLILKTTSF